MRSAWVVIAGIGVPLILMVALFRYFDRDAPSRTTPVSAPGTPPAIPAPAHSRPVQQPAALTTVAMRPAVTQVLDLAETWIDRTPSPGDERRQAGEALPRRDFARALTLFDRLLRRTPDDTTLMVGKALALSGLGRYDDALPLFEHALDRQPDDLTTRFNHAVALARAQEIDPAIAAFRELLRRSPDHTRARFNLASLLQSRGRHREAIELWRRLTDAPPVLSTQASESEQLALREFLLDAWSHRGECAIALFLPQEAEDSFKKVLDFDVKSAEAWLNIGIARAADGRRPDAITALDNALKIDPRLVPAINQEAFIFAAIYRDTGEPSVRDKVLELCERSLRLAPGQLNIRQLRMALRHEGEDPPVEIEDSASQPAPSPFLPRQ